MEYNGKFRLKLPLFMRSILSNRPSTLFRKFSKSNGAAKP